MSLIGEKFWTPKEIIQLCERLSGKTANISYIPVAAFTVLRGFFRLFEFTWNIADRLQFGEIPNDPSLKIKPTNEISWSIQRLSLEGYLQEYFGKIVRNLTFCDKTVVAVRACVCASERARIRGVFQGCGTSLKTSERAVTGSRGRGADEEQERLAAQPHPLAPPCRPRPFLPSPGPAGRSSLGRALRNPWGLPAVLCETFCHADVACSAW